MKTSQDLATYWWYRLLKVIYIALLIITLVVGSVITYSYSGNLQNNDLEVKCLYGNRITFKAIQDKKIDLSSYDNNHGLPSAIDEAFKNICEISSQDIANSKIKAAQELKELRAGANCDTSVKVGVQKLTCNLVIEPSVYTMTSTYFYEKNYFKAISYLLIFVITDLLIFEIIRRTFYYIVLGKFKN